MFNERERGRDGEREGCREGMGDGEMEIYIYIYLYIYIERERERRREGAWVSTVFASVSEIGYLFTVSPHNVLLRLPITILTVWSINVT